MENRVLFKLLLNIDSPAIKQFFMELFDPIEMGLNLTPGLRSHLYQWACLTELITEMAELMFHPKKELKPLI